MEQTQICSMSLEKKVTEAGRLSLYGGIVPGVGSIVAQMSCDCTR